MIGSKNTLTNSCGELLVRRVEKMKVVKFGGSSLASADQLMKVAQIITSDTDRRIVVVSAPGKRFKADTKVTDLLIQLATESLTNVNKEETFRKIRDRYNDIVEDLNMTSDITERISTNIQQVIDNKDCISREQFVDRIKASGEDNCALLLAAYLKKLGVAAKYVNPKEAGIIVSDEPGNARVLPETYANLKGLDNEEDILVIPGFFGFTTSGTLVTFPRGGSDISGAIIAAGVSADLYENFTDVDSVFCVNPAMVNKPKEIKELTYREMRELSYAGFSVFHDEALIPAFRAQIPVCIKNTNNPEAAGTFIVPEREYSREAVVGIASDSGFCSIYVSKYLMNREIGFGRRLLEILEDEHISYEHVPSGIDDISIILREDQMDEGTEERVLKRIEKELRVDHVLVERNLALIMIVGEGMNETIGIAARATRAFSNANVNIEMINQGSSEVSMMFGVKSSEVTQAVQALYEEFFVRIEVMESSK